MKLSELQPAVLVLEDGTVFYGKAAGKIGTTTGEICFNTGMTGYQEVFTDPSYFGQILVATNAHIGNYGVHPGEIESESMKISGLVTRNFTTQFSRKQAKESIQEYYQHENIVAICDVDTRAVVRHIRSKGAMNAIISSEILDIGVLREKLQQVPSMMGLELSSKVSTTEPYFLGNPNSRYKVAVLDLGAKKNILRCLTERDCYLQVFPARTTYKDIKKWEPDGFLLSNGPGDPAAMPYVVGTVSAVLEENNPLFGICLGHQILAESCGITTYKMHIGHRGINHPVKNLVTGHCEITSQNHGFSINKDEVVKSDRVEMTHLNLNDQSVEGIRVKGKKAFSVQYHPEAAPGPHDSRYLFDEFVSLMAKE
jgi:carbamoyl-phosphate synthase small subunit